jgi:hypothetical protein
MEMSKYSDGKIYKLTSKHTDKIYVGSTIQKLCNRYRLHNSNYKKWKKMNEKYITSFILFELGNVEIKLIIDFPCNSKKELERKEGEFIKSFGDNCVNQMIAGRTMKEYQETNRDAIATYKKEYQETNRDAIATYKKEYQETNRDAISTYKKEYREKNRDAILSKKKEYYEANRETILTKNKEYRDANRVKIANKASEYRVSKRLLLHKL